MLTMKKSKKKKSTAKNAAKPAKRKAASATTAKGGNKVNKQPQVKQSAAVANAMFLYTDDAWSLRYFDQNDLHFKEREVFG